MTKEEFKNLLAELQLNEEQAAVCFGISSRALYRFLEGEPIRQPYIELLNSWIKLKNLGVEWRPSSYYENFCKECGHKK